jgi:hypothetical protein
MMHKKFCILIIMCTTMAIKTNQRHIKEDGAAYVRRGEKLKDYTILSAHELKAKSKEIYDLIKNLMRAASSPFIVSHEQRQQIMHMIESYKAYEKKTLAHQKNR